MQTFAIKSSHDDCTLKFFDRVPDDPVAPIESFFVKISRVDLSAVARVWAGYAHSRPTAWLCELAQHWMGWHGERVWESLEGELTLSAKNDCRGHIAITVTLRSGHYDYDCCVVAVVVVDAGLLDGLAKRALAFFGQDGVLT